MTDKAKQWKMTKEEQARFKELRAKADGYRVLLDDFAFLRNKLTKEEWDWWANFKKNHDIPDEQAITKLIAHINGTVKVYESGEEEFNRLSERE